MYGTSSSTARKQTQETDALLSSRPELLRRASSRRKRVTMGSTRSVLDNVFAAPDSSRQTKAGKKKPNTNANSNKTKDGGGTTVSYSFLYSLLNPRSKQWQAMTFKSFISFVILADLCLFVISTDEQFAQNYFSYLYFIEGIVSCIFLVEYVARLVTITERSQYGKLGPIQGRFTYMITPGAVLDAFATLPFFLELCTGWNLPTLTYIRIFRLFRILKTQGYVRAIDAVYRVIYYNRQILYVALLVCCFLVFLTAVLLYYLRPPADTLDPDNAASFASILATLYLSTLMLTGQGGPEGDLPWYTKAVVLLTSLFSVAMFAIPASMLTWGFEAEAARMAKLSWRRAKKTSASSSSSSYSSDDGNSSGHSTDEEYFKIIAGEDEEEGESEASKAWMRAQKLSFQKADTDNSGSISMTEYIRMQIEKDNAAATAVVSNGASQLRIETLEKKVNENCRKLDRILDILEQKR